MSLRTRIARWLLGTSPKLVASPSASEVAHMLDLARSWQAERRSYAPIPIEDTIAALLALKDRQDREAVMHAALEKMRGENVKVVNGDDAPLDVDSTDCCASEPNWVRSHYHHHVSEGTVRFELDARGMWPGRNEDADEWIRARLSEFGGVWEKVGGSWLNSNYRAMWRQIRETRDPYARRHHWTWDGLAPKPPSMVNVAFTPEVEVRFDFDNEPPHVGDRVRQVGFDALATVLAVRGQQSFVQWDATPHQVVTVATGGLVVVRRCIDPVSGMLEPALPVCDTCGCGEGHCKCKRPDRGPFPIHPDYEPTGTRLEGIQVVGATTMADSWKMVYVDIDTNWFTLTPSGNDAVAQLRPGTQAPRLWDLVMVRRRVAEHP